LKAQNEQVVIPLVKQGYTTNFPVDKCIPIPHPPLVIDYNGPPPSKVIEDFGTIGFERIKMQRNDNIIRFPTVTLANVRAIKNTNPNMKTPAPSNSVNIEAFDTWILVLRVLSNFLRTHVYPAFRDDGHLMEEVESMVENIMISKRRLDELTAESVKKRKGNDGQVVTDDGGADSMDVEDDDNPPLVDVELRKAKPPSSMEHPWGTSDRIPNASGLFFPYIPELATYDDVTVPSVFENHLLASLGNTPEQQIDRLSRIKSAWGIISKTDTGNIMAHLCKVILLSITAQARTFPIIQDGIYQGSILSGGRFFIGLNGQVFRPLSFDKLQEEAGSYHMHSRVLLQIAEIATGLEAPGEDDEEKAKLADITSSRTNRHLRSVLMRKDLNESDRDEIRKLVPHLHFKNDSHLPVNSQTINRVLTHMTVAEDKEDLTLPMHHSALFSRDKVFVSLSAFGFQAPSFSLDNCPKVSLADPKPPSTLVIRQKTLEIATVDWKNMIDSKEIKNNPRNLSRANRDRTITGNDKVVMWKCLKDMCGSNQGDLSNKEADVGFVVDTGDGLDDW